MQAEAVVVDVWFQLRLDAAAVGTRQTADAFFREPVGGSMVHI